MTNLQIQYINITKLEVVDYNPRQLKEDVFKSKVEEMKSDTWQWSTPLIINDSKELCKNKKYRIVSGEQRYRCAMWLYSNGYKDKFETIPCVILTIDDEKQEQETNIKLNTHWGEWDIDKLSSLDLTPKQLLDMDFKAKEIENMFDIKLDGLDLDTGEPLDNIDNLDNKENENKKKNKCPNCGHTW